MLKNPNVMRISLDTINGLCRVYMINGDEYCCNHIYEQEDFIEYISLLKQDDELIFQTDTMWVLTTNDSWSDWKDTYQQLDVCSVLMFDHLNEERVINL